jgi:hypothetical protein
MTPEEAWNYSVQTEISHRDWNTSDDQSVRLYPADPAILWAAARLRSHLAQDRADRWHLLVLVLVLLLGAAQLAASIWCDWVGG